VPTRLERITSELNGKLLAVIWQSSKRRSNNR
jgi:hypothetical protein